MPELEFAKLSVEDQERLVEIDYTPPVYYVGKQWAVTGHGIEQIRSEGESPYYHIAGDHLTQEMGDGGWPGHMTSKNWVDVGDFVKAFEIAKKVHQ